MKKIILFMLILSMAVFMLTGCGSEPGDTTGDKKEILFEIKNVSGEDWVLIKGTYGSAEYKGEIEAIYVKGLTVKAGESIRKIGSSDYGEETSKTTYTYKCQCVAAGKPSSNPDEKLLYPPWVCVQDLTFAGTYNEYAVIEWDGTSFKQAK